MPVYASRTQVGEYLALSDAGQELPDDEATADEIIDRAELDVDRLLSPAVTQKVASGRKLEPFSLPAAKREALVRAVAAQVEFRLAVEESELVGDDTTTGVGEVRFGPTPRPPGPKCVEELSGFGFPWRSGTVAPPPVEGDPFVVGVSRLGDPL